MGNARWSAVLCGVMVSGCTTSLSVSEVAAPSSDKRPTTLPAGFVYDLPAAVLTPTAYVAIRDCPVDADLEKQLKSVTPAGLKPVKEVTFVVGGAIPVAQVPDQRIAIDYRNLKKFLKTSSIATERWPNGMLKSVNASIEDQTPQAIAALAAAAGSIALLTTGAPASGALLAAAAPRPAPGGGRTPPGAAPKPLPPVTVSFLTCNDVTRDLVDRRKVAAKSREDASGLLDKAAAAATQLGAQPNADQAKLDKLKADVAKYSAQVDSATADLAAIDAQLTLPLDTITPTAGGPALVVPDDGSVPPSKVRSGLVFTSNKLDAFIGAHFVEASALLPAAKKASFDKRACLWNPTTKAGVPDETCSGLGAVQRVLTKVARVELKDKTLKPVNEATGDRRPDSAALGSVRKEKDGIPGADVAANKGIIYVEPAKLRLEMSAATVGPQAVVARSRIIKTADVTVPQLGRYFALPLSAGFGQRVELKATFAEDGSLLTSSFANPKTSGAAVADTIKQLTAAAVSTRDSMEDRKLKLLKNQSEALAALAGTAESVKKLTPTTDPLADINAQLAKANAEAALAEAQLRIQTARAKLTTP